MGIACGPSRSLAYSRFGRWIVVVLPDWRSFHGWSAATKVEIEVGDDHDPSWVVIDEVVGQWIALLPVSYGAMMMGVDLLRLWPGILAAFLLFRLFDITKPWLVGRADARGDALGVMLDDVWAGVFAAIGVAILAAIGHGVFM